MGGPLRGLPHPCIRRVGSMLWREMHSVCSIAHQPDADSPPSVHHDNAAAGGNDPEQHHQDYSHSKPGKCSRRHRDQKMQRKTRKSPMFSAAVDQRYMAGCTVADKAAAAAATWSNETDRSSSRASSSSSSSSSSAPAAAAVRATTSPSSPLPSPTPSSSTAAASPLLSPPSFSFSSARMASTKVPLGPNASPPYSSKQAHHQQPEPSARDKGLGELIRKFKMAARRKDFRRAADYHKTYLEKGGHPRHWMFNSLISMYAKRSELDQALNTANMMRDAGLKWDNYTYGAVLDALSKAQMPPYLLDQKYAEEARRYFDEMRSEGLELNHVMFNSLMDCYAKAGLPDQVFAVMEEMEQHGLQPGLMTFNILINACGKGGQPLRAQNVIEEMMPQAGVQPDVVSWNGLLGSYAQAGQIDNAYYAWQKMKKLGVLPTRVTAAHLSEVFVGSPVLLEELLEEARGREKEARDQLHLGIDESSKVADRSSGRGSRGSEFVAFDTPEDPYFLDLHRLSQSSAQAELLRRLQLLTSLPVDQEANNINGLKSCGGGQGGTQADFLIVTGHGRHSRTRGAGVLRTSVRDVLRKNDVAFEESANAGRITIPFPEIESLRLRRKVIEDQAKLYKGASMRLMVMGCALFGLLSTTYLMKELVPLAAN